MSKDTRDLGTNRLLDLFSMYMKITGVPSLEDPVCHDPALKGKKLGIINGSAWIILWSTYFGRKILPGVKMINVGNEAVQLNFMEAYHSNKPCPPQLNIDAFMRYAEDLISLWGVDAILISCSTMNRAYRSVQMAMEQYGVPVVQIDEAMMERAVRTNGKILVVATHGPTVKSTQALLEETAGRLNKKAFFAGSTAEEAFHLLGEGDIKGHNDVIAAAIRESLRNEPVDIVVLAQLSMTVFKLSFPDCEKAFGIPVLTSGETGFERAGEVLRALPPKQRISAAGRMLRNT